MHCRRLVHLVVKLHILDDKFHKGLAVGSVVYGERALETYMLGILPEYTCKDGMKRTHPKPRRHLRPHKSLDSFAHLAGRLIGKCQCKYPPRLISVSEKMHYLIGQHPGLA